MQDHPDHMQEHPEKGQDHLNHIQDHPEKGQDHPEQPIVFIRHGESMKNRAVHEFRTARNLGEDWDILQQDPEFFKQVIYNPALIDCHLSPKGI